jgi:hypothetical protein
MKKRVAPILTIAVVLVLVSGLAYAARKKDEGKPADLQADSTMHEEEALQAELLAVTETRDVKLPGLGEAGKVINAAGIENIKDRMPAQQGE